MSGFKLGLFAVGTDSSEGEYGRPESQFCTGVESDQFDMVMAHLLAQRDTKAWRRAYVFEADEVIAAFYRERADYLVRQLDPEAASQLFCTAARPAFFDAIEAAEIPWLTGERKSLISAQWADQGDLLAAQRWAQDLFKDPECGAVTISHQGMLAAAWERRHLGDKRPIIVVAEQVTRPLTT